MPLWVGETWNCYTCGWTNSVLRRKCRNCGWPKAPPQVAKGKALTLIGLNQGVKRHWGETDKSLRERIEANNYHPLIKRIEPELVWWARLWNWLTVK